MGKDNTLRILGKALWARSNTNTIFLIVICVLLLGLIFRNSLSSVKIGNYAAISFDGQEWKYLCEIEMGFRQLTRDATREIDRTDVKLVNLYSRAFVSYYGAKGNVSHYRKILRGVLNDNIKNFTLSSVYRNHFPLLTDTVAVRKYCQRISTSALSLSVSEIEDDWPQDFPDLDRAGYQKYLEKFINEEAVRAKSESLIRIETMKLSIVHTIQLSHPQKSESVIKRDWSERW